MKSLLIKDTTKEEREEIVRQALWGNCGTDCEFCSGCDNRGGGRIDGIYQDYIDGKKEIREINEEYRAPFVRGVIIFPVKGYGTETDTDKSMFMGTGTE